MRVHVLLAAVCLAVPFVAAPEAQAATTPITACGQTVTTNAVLMQNLHCTGDGIVVGAGHITIDLHGFRLRGDRDLNDDGVADTGFDSITIKDGVLRNFGDGIQGRSGTDRMSISNVVVSGNSDVGIFVLGDEVSIKSSTASSNAAEGIGVGGTGASIKSVIASANGGAGLAVTGAPGSSIVSSSADGNVSFGIEVTGDGISIKSSEASGNGLEGVDVIGDGAKLKGNRADANGFSGEASDLTGVGIDVQSSSIPPSGTNEALGNDDPSECFPASLC